MSAARRAAARLRAVMLASRADSTAVHTSQGAQQLASLGHHHRRAVSTARPSSAAAAAAAAEPAPAAAAAPPAPAAAAESVYTPRRSAALTAHDVGLYYPIDPARLLPEALRPLHQAGYAPRPAALSRKAGCRSLQQELEAASGGAAALGGGGGGGKQGAGGGGGGGKKQDAAAGGKGKAAGAATGAFASGAASSAASASSPSAAAVVGAGARPPSLMYRRCIHDLRRALEDGTGPSRLLLEGPAGSGKSLALAALVEWARQQQPGAAAALAGGGDGRAATAAAAAAKDGWVALYVPSAAALTSGGFFERRADDGTYDTLLSAQAVLRGAAEAHADVLVRMPRRGPAGGGGAGLPAGVAAALLAAEEAAGVPRGDKATLMDLVDAGLRADVDEARRAVECVLALVRELGAAATLGAAAADTCSSSSSSCSPLPRVLIAIDDYNALHWTTGYGRTIFVEGKGGGGTATGAAPAGGRRYSYRQAVPAGDLNLARGLRLISLPPPAASAPLSSAALTSLALGPHARVVAAATASRGVGASADAAAAAEADALGAGGGGGGGGGGAGGGGRYAVPRFGQAEVANALHHYYERGMLGCPPSGGEVRKMLALTAGNGHELRRLALEVTAVDAADGFV